MISLRSRCVIAILVFFAFSGFAAAVKAVHYRLLSSYQIGGGDGKSEYWDYVTFDPSSRRLFLSHGTEVDVVNADTGMLSGTISGLKRDHGIALVNALNKGFISNGGANEVVAFDLKTLAVTAHISTGGNPDCIVYDEASRRIFTMNGDSKDSTAIDPATNAVVGTVPMGGRPEYAVVDGRGMIYDNIEDKNEVAALDTKALSIKSRWPISPAGQATAMAMDREHRRLFIGGRNKVFAIMNADDGKIIQTFPIGEGVDSNVYEPKTKLVFSAVREGVLYAFYEDTPDKFSLVDTVKTQFGARNMALDPKTHKIYIDTSDFKPSEATDQRPAQPLPVPGTFRLLVYGK